MNFGRWFLMIALCGTLSACRNAGPAPPAGTGAREAVTEFFEALARQDWDAAFGQLHADTKKQFDRAAFERAARDYCQRFGFPFGKVTIRSCDEQGEKAIAQVVLSDAKGSVKHRYREGAVLQKGANGWGIVLSSNFGP